MASIKRANSTHLYHPTVRTRENTSELRQRHTQVSVPCITSARRQESADHFLNTNYNNNVHHKATTPESSHSTNGLNDYFTYISENQNNRQSSTKNDEDQLIPQIRLAPPINHQEAPDEAFVIEDNVSLHVPTTPQLKQNGLKESASISIILDDIFFTLFPTLSGWNSKTTFSKLSSLVALPLVFVFTLTLPIAEPEDIKVDDIEVVNTIPVEESVATPQVVVIASGEENTHTSTLNNKSSYLTVPSERSLSELLITEEEESGSQLVWCRWLVATQAICATTFVTSVMACKYVLIVLYILTNHMMT